MDSTYNIIIADDHPLFRNALFQSVHMAVSGGTLAGEDDDCENGACGREFFDSSSPYICCPSGAVQGNVVAGGETNYCTEQLSGAGCPFDSLCASGVCNDGICQ